MKQFLGALLLVLATLGPAQAQERVTLGWGRLFTNDLLGDGRDRWRTGAYTVSRIRGPSWQGVLPGRPGEVLEFRIRAETLAPADLVAPDAGDRRYAGILSFGLHTHFDMGGIDTSVGVDLVVTGPQTGMGRFQRKVHDALGLPEVRVLGAQIEDGVHPTLVAEAARAITLGPARLRPFAEVQAGAESLLRIGGDLEFGTYARGALMLRDGATGQRYRAVMQDRLAGFSLTFGGDLARVLDSVYLPDGGAATPNDTRQRLRAGLHWQGDSQELFYGLTWLGKEFRQQSEGQLLGSVNLRVQF